MKAFVYETLSVLCSVWWSKGLVCTENACIHEQETL